MATSGLARHATALPPGIALRATLDADRPFLVALFASTRADEMALVPWPEDQKAAFLRSQFELQDRHYRRHYPAAEHLVVTAAGAAIGRVVVDPGPDRLELMDIALLPQCRARGVGTALVAAVVAWGDALGLPVTLYVEPGNPARRLYERMGFGPLELLGLYQLMRREAAGGFS